MDDGLGDTAIIQRCCCIRQDAPRRRHLTNAIWQDNVTGCRKLPQTGNTVQAGQTASGAAGCWSLDGGGSALPNQPSQAGVGCGIILQAVAFLQELRKFYTQVNVDNNFNNYP
ncbi:hypothetical protein T09_6006 [Trichinella sp. T9]|nr:hypothetical protein T09_6006 [Trichinella sp. T9]